MRHLLLVAATLWLAFAAGLARAEPASTAGLVAIPPLTARITDLTNTLEDAQRAELERRVADFEHAKGSQIAVLVVPTTQPESIEQYSIRVVEAWKLGRKGVDDGLLLLVAKNDHRVRFEVGYGLEGIFPDAVANRVIEQDITPRFRNGDFYGGILEGVTTAISVISGESLPPPEPEPARQAAGAHGVGAWLPGAFVALVAMQFLSRFFGRALVTGLYGVGVGIVGGVAAGSLLVGLFIALVAGFVCLVFTTVGGFIPVGGGGGFRGGGGFGGGGFSGGGGGFGGGGASGSW